MKKIQPKYKHNDVVFVDNVDGTEYEIIIGGNIQYPADCKDSLYYVLFENHKGETEKLLCPAKNIHLTYLDAALSALKGLRRKRESMNKEIDNKVTQITNTLYAIARKRELEEVGK